jgi:hypothetical protein
MIGYSLALALAAAAPAQAQQAQAQQAQARPAQAQGDMWRHEGSGISIPRRIGELRLRNVEDGSDGAGTDVYAQLGTGGTVVTVYVYRSAYPNVAMWFERVRHAMADTVGSEGVAVAPRTFTLAGAPAPNGLREEFAVPKNNQMGAQATGVAMAQVGEWILKVRISAQRLDQPGIARMMDEVLAAVRVERFPFVLPLTIPGRCPEPNRMAADQLRSPSPAAVQAAAGEASVWAQARGRGGLAAEPQSWCRDATEVPAQYGTVYRRRDGAGWVALLGDAGTAVSAERIDLPGDADGALFASSTARTDVVALFEGVPHPDAGVITGLPVLAGRARGLAEVRGR